MMRRLLLFLTTFSIVVPSVEGDDNGIDELEAVIEFDEEDDLFKMLSEHDSTCVHLYSRKESKFLSRRKAFRAAAKKDIDLASSEGLSRR